MIDLGILVYTTFGKYLAALMVICHTVNHMTKKIKVSKDLKKEKKMENCLSKIPEGYRKVWDKVTKSFNSRNSCSIIPRFTDVSGTGLCIARISILTPSAARFYPHICKLKLDEECSKYIAKLNELNTYDRFAGVKFMEDLPLKNKAWVIAHNRCKNSV